MNHQFEWQETKIEYREERSTKHGTESDTPGEAGGLMGSAVSKTAT